MSPYIKTYLIPLVIVYAISGIFDVVGFFLSATTISYKTGLVLEIIAKIGYIIAIALAMQFAFTYTIHVSKELLYLKILSNGATFDQVR